MPPPAAARTGAADPDPGPVDDDYRTWQRLAPLGLLLVGSGVSVTGDATLAKAAGRPLRWVAEGTAGLVLIGAGLSCFGEAVKRRALWEVRRGGTPVSRRPGSGSPAA